jgi:hypothetical protein
MDKTLRPLAMVLSLLFFSSGTIYAQVQDPEIESLLQIVEEGGSGADQLRDLWDQRSLELIKDLVGAEFTDDAKQREAARLALDRLKPRLVRDYVITDVLSDLLTQAKAPLVSRTIMIS